MADLLLNKQINVWRGPSEPPTKYHLWVLDNQQLRLYDGEKWVTFLDNPGLTVTENNDGTITIANGDTYFKLAASGSALQIIKLGDTITFESNALTTIPTDEWLTWTNKLIHNNVDPSKAVHTYGPSTDSSGNSSFEVPSIAVDEKGHVVKGESKIVSVPDRVVQNPVQRIEGSDVTEYEVLLAGSAKKDRETGETNKDESVALEIRYQGNSVTKVLKTPGIEAKGGVTVQGDLTIEEGYVIHGTVVGEVQGTATPTDHADVTAKYGAGTSAGNGIDAMFGHVKLQDTLPTQAPDAGYTEAGKGIAATPLMVYTAVETAKQYADDLFGSDFAKDTETNKYNLTWTEI